MTGAGRLRPAHGRLSPRLARRDGAVAIQIALMLVVIVGFVSLGTEIVLLLATSRHMQSAADAAALAAVTARLSGHPADYTQEAFALTAAAGFAKGVDGTTVAVNNPPATGNYKTAPDAVEVLIAQPQTLALARVIYKGSFVLHARAVARVSAGSNACVLALDTAASGAFAMNGDTVANFINCDLAVNSTSTNAVSLVGGAVVNAGHLYDAGGYSLSGGSAINATITTQAPNDRRPLCQHGHADRRRRLHRRSQCEDNQVNSARYLLRNQREHHERDFDPHPGRKLHHQRRWSGVERRCQCNPQGHRGHDRADRHSQYRLCDGKHFGRLHG